MLMNMLASSWGEAIGTLQWEEDDNEDDDIHTIWKLPTNKIKMYDKSYMGFDSFGICRQLSFFFFSEILSSTCLSPPPFL